LHSSLSLYAEKTLAYQADTRLPLELLEKCPFVYTGPNPGAFLVGAIQGTIEHRGRLLQRFYPLTVSQVSSNNHIIDKVFGLCFFYHNDEDDLVLFLTHPCWLNRSESSSVIDFFLTQVEELAKYSACKLIELEFHHVTSYVAFPTSFTHLSHDLSKISVDPHDLRLLQSHGFWEEREIHCYEQSIVEIEDRARKAHHPASTYAIKDVAPEEFTLLKPKTETFPTKAYTLSNIDPVTTFSHPLSKDVVSAAYTRTRWFRRGELAGFFRWTLNLFEPSREYNLPVPLLFNYAFTDYSFEYGKIIDWGLRDDDIQLSHSLLLHVAHAMKVNGVQRLQIAHVTDTQSSMTALLQYYNFRRVHTINLLQKRVN
jgi:hypothetical protein